MHRGIQAGSGRPTADAMECGRDCMAVFGPVDAPFCCLDVVARFANPCPSLHLFPLCPSRPPRCLALRQAPILDLVTTRSRMRLSCKTRRRFALVRRKCAHRPSSRVRALTAAMVQDSLMRLRQGIARSSGADAGEYPALRPLSIRRGARVDRCTVVVGGGGRRGVCKDMDEGWFPASSAPDLGVVSATTCSRSHMHGHRIP